MVFMIKVVQIGLVNPIKKVYNTIGNFALQWNCEIECSKHICYNVGIKRCELI